MKLNLLAFVVVTMLLSFGFSSRAEAQEGRWAYGSRRNYTVYAPDSSADRYYDYYDSRYHARRYYRHRYWAERHNHDYYYHNRYKRYNRYYDRWDDSRYYYRGGGY